MNRLLPILVLVLSACVATPPLVMGEAAPPMTMPPASLDVVVLAHDGSPLRGAEVSFATVTSHGDVVTDDAGRATVRWHEDGVELVADAPAHLETTLEVTERPAGEVALQLEPTVLDGIVSGPGGGPLSGARISMGSESAVSDADGRFQLLGVDAGTLSVSRPAYEPTTSEWAGEGQVAVNLEPFTVRGLYVNPGLMRGDGAVWPRLLDTVRDTEINTLVIDVKSETGRVYFDSGVPLATESGAEVVTWDAAEVRADADEVGAYVIARIVAFQDPFIAKARPELAIHDTSTGQPYNHRDQYFLDPTDAAARQYNIDLAVAACDAGIDEIQFDYVRYPDNLEANLSRMRFDGPSDDASRPLVIRDFLDDARSALHPRGCAVSADIFGYITSSSGDGKIGQNLEAIAEVVDAVSPMVYPSHYSTGWYGFSNPNEHPGEVVEGALDDALARIEDVTILRPWLQDFYNSPPRRAYDASAEAVRAQVAATEARGLGWMLWHSNSEFTFEVLRAG